MPYKPLAYTHSSSETHGMHATCVERLIPCVLYISGRQQPPDLTGYGIPDRRASNKTAALQPLVRQRNSRSIWTQMCHNIWTDGRSSMGEKLSADLLLRSNDKNGQQKPLSLVNMYGISQNICQCWIKGTRGQWQVSRFSLCLAWKL